MTNRLTHIGPTPLYIASCLIFNDAGQLLLLRRHADDMGGGMWALPGGKQEPNEAAEVGAMREVLEETGIALPGIAYLGTHEVRMPQGTVHLQAFHGRVQDNVTVILNPDEHDTHRWFALEELLDTDHIIWALPTMLRDFGLLADFTEDPTLRDGSQAILLERA